MSAKVLIVVAARHGGTRGIGEALRDEMARQGVDAALSEPGAAPPHEGFDALVLGSAVYVGRWMDDAKAYARAHRDALRARPTSLFSSGPLGDPPWPPEEPADAAEVAALLGARGHATFAGRLEKAGLGLAERAVVRMVKAPYEDPRPWARIAEWARSGAEHARAAAGAG